MRAAERLAHIDGWRVVAGLLVFADHLGSDGPANLNMTEFFKRSVAYSLQNSLAEPPEAPSSGTNFFRNVQRISFTLVAANSQVGTLSSTGTKIDSISRNAGLNSSPQATPPVDLSYIIISYPPLTVSELDKSRHESGEQK